MLNLSVMVLLIYAIFFFIMALIALIPSVIQAIGLARICNKLGAFRPVWSWVWAFLLPPVAILRAGDAAAEREDPYRKSLLKQGVVSVIVFSVLATLAVIGAVIMVLSSELTLPDAVVSVVALVTVVLTVLTLLASVWMAVLLCISHFRIFKAYVPTWGAWLLIAGMVILSELAFLIFPILSFIPIKPAGPVHEYLYESET